MDKRVIFFDTLGFGILLVGVWEEERWWDILRNHGRDWGIEWDKMR